MKKIQMFILVLVVLLSVTPAFAHEEGNADNSAQGLVKQAIAFLEGVHDADKALMDIQKAANAVGSDQLDQSKLNQAQNLLKVSSRANIDQAKTLLVEALGKDPRGAVELTFRPHYASTPLNTALLIMAGILVVLGIAVISKVKPNH